MSHKEGKSRVVPAVILILIICLAMVATIFVGFMGLGPFSFLKTPVKPDDTPTEYKYTRNVKWSVTDIWVGGAKQPPLTIYKYGTLESYDSGTPDSSGNLISAKSYASGERYWVYATLANARYYYDVTIPTYVTPNTESYHFVNLDFYTIGAYSISATLSNTTVIADGGSLNVTGYGDDYPTLTITIRDTAATDSGVMTYFDPVKAMDRETYWYMSVAGNQYEQLVVKNKNMIYQSSTTRYYGEKIDAYKLCLDKKPDSTYNVQNGKELDGVYSFSLQLDCSGFAHSDGPEVAFFLYTHGNIANFGTFGTNLSDVVELQATDYNIELDGL